MSIQTARLSAHGHAALHTTRNTYDEIVGAYRSSAVTERGDCKGQDPELWFPTRQQGAHDAISVCSTCPLRDQCLELALESGIDHGVWGAVDFEHDKATVRELRARRENKGALAS